MVRCRHISFSTSFKSTAIVYLEWVAQATTSSLSVTPLSKVVSSEGSVHLKMDLTAWYEIATWYELPY